MIRSRRSHTPLEMIRLQPLRCVAAMLLACNILVLPIPSAAASVVVEDAHMQLQRFEQNLIAPLTRLHHMVAYKRGRMPRSASMINNQRPPVRARSRTERLNLAASVVIDTAPRLQLKAGETLRLTGAALDQHGSLVQGVALNWSSRADQIATVSADGLVTAGHIGTTVVSASAGTLQAAVQISVLAGPQLAVAAKADQANQVAPTPIESGTEYHSLFVPANAVGSPPNQVPLTAPVAPAATGRGHELLGSQSFNFDIGLLNLPGRNQHDLRLSLSYNSRVWNLSATPRGVRHLTFDVDRSWPAPGFSLGFGSLEDGGSGSYTLRDADGTRHELLGSDLTQRRFSTVDSTYTQLTISGGSRIITYANGTRVELGADNGARAYPTKLTDNAGNYILIAYVNGVGPRISRIQDTLGRYVACYYNPAGELVALTAPGYDDGPERQVMRFYFQDLPINEAGSFAASSSLIIHAPTTVRVLKYAYQPGSARAYRFDYSAPYGVVRSITQSRGPRASTTSLTDAGNITDDGQPSASSAYNYPIRPAGLDTAPAYTERTDDWAGRTTTEPSTYKFAQSTDEGAAITTVTDPVGVVTETRSQPLSDTIVTKQTLGSGRAVLVMNTAKVEWQVDDEETYNNRRQKRLQITDDAGMTRTIDFQYAASAPGSSSWPTFFGNVADVIEYDYSSVAAQPGPVLRRTHIDYVRDPAWITRGNLHLVTSVKVSSGASAAPLTRVDLAYDNYVFDANGMGHPDPDGTALGARPRAGAERIIMHDAAYDPYAPAEPHCYWRLPPGCHPSEQNPCELEWYCQLSSPFDPATLYRGKTTKFVSYVDAANPATSQTSMLRRAYDIAGNAIAESLNCCRQGAYSYSASSQYAYVEGISRGSGQESFTASALFDFNTGMKRVATDENQLSTYFYYYPNSLRPYITTYPDGGSVTRQYFDDQLFNDPDAAHRHSSVLTITALDGTRTVSAWQFFDGRGAQVRAFGADTANGNANTVDFELDHYGRTRAVSNPYFAQAGVDTPINPAGIWTIRNFDALGRTVNILLPDASSIRREYTGKALTITDESGAQSRQTIDALGRLAQVGTADADGHFTIAASYTYDAADNLLKLVQGAQRRYFKYDSLARMTFERQVEQDAPYASPSDAQTDNNASWSKKLEYTQDGQISDVWDARAVHTHVEYDGINRISAITYAGETGTQTPAVTVSYDAPAPGYYNRGKLTRIATAASADAPATAQAFDYDSMGRPVRHTQTIDTAVYALAYAYNYLGQLTSETYPSGRIINSTYDDAGRQVALAEGARSFVTELEYNAAGDVETEHWGNGAIRAIAFNNRHQIRSVDLSRGHNVLQHFDYRYGSTDIATGTVDESRNRGQLGRIDTTIGNGQSGVKQWSQTLAYDQLGRLVKAKEVAAEMGALNWDVNYGYDQYGNRFTADGPYQVAPDDIDAARNRFVSKPRAQIAYDGAGNLVLDQKFHHMQYSYDANNRLRRSQGEGWFSSAAFDGLGQRVRTFDGASHTIVYDAFGRIVSEYDGAAWKRDYIYEDKFLLATVEQNSVAYLLLDHQGSARLALDERGRVSARRDYKPFGETIGSGVGQRAAADGYAAQLGSRIRFAQTDIDTGSLDHAWFRMYDYDAGRWTSPDPYRGSIKLADPQTLNLYTYARNDPADLIDPSGLLCYYVRYYTCVRMDGATECADAGARIFCTPDFIRPALQPLGGDTPSGGGGGGSDSAQPNRTNSGAADPNAVAMVQDCTQRQTNACQLIRSGCRKRGYAVYTSALFGCTFAAVAGAIIGLLICDGVATLGVALYMSSCTDDYTACMLKLPDTCRSR